MSVTITLVTPSYNQAAFLGETLRSVISQRQDVHEYFVFDGGSADGSAALIRNHAEEIDFWVSEKDKGQSDAIRRGFARATGDVLGWVNSDDLLLPGSLMRVRAAFESDPSIDIVAGYLAIIGPEGRVISLPCVPSGSSFFAFHGLIQISQQATFFRRSLYERVGGLDPSLHCAMDLDLWSRFYIERAKWHFLPIHLAAFRKHDEAKGAGNSWWKQYQDEKAVVKERYPLLYQSQQTHPGILALYRALQIASGRQAVSAWKTFRARNKSVADVFGS